MVLLCPGVPFIISSKCHGSVSSFVLKWQLRVVLSGRPDPKPQTALDQVAVHPGANDPDQLLEEEESLWAIQWHNLLMMCCPSKEPTHMIARSLAPSMESHVANQTNEAATSTAAG